MLEECVLILGFFSIIGVWGLEVGCLGRARVQVRDDLV